MNQTDLFDDIELQTPSNTDTSVKDVVADGSPSPTSPDWNDYVLGLFEKNELFDGRPKCAGLRRVAELVLGQVVSSKPTQVFPPSGGNEVGRATVVWEVIFSNGSVFSDVADSWEGNTDDAFCVFNTATAATRAEGRALRKALRLSTVAAEEMTSKDTASITRSISQTKTMAETEGEYDDSSRMTDNQSNFIDIKCKQLNVDTTKLFKEFKVSTSRKITKKQASAAIEQLNKYQQESVPDKVLGYNEDWRN
tara:strand:+ start:895 stop:1647 length:753 start_codon:yes stop_codon:yes gene_type:complete